MFEKEQMETGGVGGRRVLDTEKGYRDHCAVNMFLSAEIHGGI